MKNLIQDLCSHLNTHKKQSLSDDLTVVWIHGANQSSACWNYIREKCAFSNEILINYSSLEKFYTNLENIKLKIGNTPVFLVGHSLGGIYALHLTKHCDVKGSVSLSTPFRGSSAADWAKFIVPQYQLFKEIGRRSKPVLEADKIKISVPWTQIVSTTGSVPYLDGPNDGVCTVASMKHRKSEMECVLLKSTHYEVMVSADAVQVIQNRYNAINNFG
jgi:pimeloyl-ACP methyl ester carboxylesterase